MMQRGIGEGLATPGRPLEAGPHVVESVGIDAAHQDVACQLDLVGAVADQRGRGRHQVPADDAAGDGERIEQRHRGGGTELPQRPTGDHEGDGHRDQPQQSEGDPRRQRPGARDLPVDRGGGQTEQDEDEPVAMPGQHPRARSGRTRRGGQLHPGTTDRRGQSLPGSFASLSSSPSNGRESMTRRLEPDDLYAIKLVEDPQLTPDGDRVAYVVVEIDRKTYEYHRSIWVAGTETGQPRRYTAGENDTTPRWSPDGRSLAFTRAPAGEVKPKTEEERDRGVGKPQIWLLPADGGEARQLTSARWGASGPVWSPDGTVIVYVAEAGEPDDPEAEDAGLHEKLVPAVRRIDRLWNRLDGRGWIYERRSHLFRIRSEGGQPEQLTDGDWDDGSPAYSPDGRRIAFTSDRTADRWSWPANDIWVLDLASKGLTRLTDETVFAGPPAWSPDGRQVAFAASPRRHEDGYTDLLVADPGGPGAVRKLTEDFLPTFFDSAIDDQRAGHGGPDLYWSTAGREIYSQAAGRGSTLVYAVPVVGGTPRLVVGGQRRIYALSMDRDRRPVAVASSDPSTPGALFVHH